MIEVIIELWTMHNTTPTNLCLCVPLQGWFYLSLGKLLIIHMNTRSKYGAIFIMILQHEAFLY